MNAGSYLVCSSLFLSWCLSYASKLSVSAYIMFCVSFHEMNLSREKWSQPWASVPRVSDVKWLRWMLAASLDLSGDQLKARQVLLEGQNFKIKCLNFISKELSTAEVIYSRFSMTFWEPRRLELVSGGFKSEHWSSPSSGGATFTVALPVCNSHLSTAHRVERNEREALWDSQVTLNFDISLSSFSAVLKGDVIIKHRTCAVPTPTPYLASSLLIFPVHTWALHLLGHPCSVVSSSVAFFYSEMWFKQWLLFNLILSYSWAFSFSSSYNLHFCMCFLYLTHIIQVTVMLSFFKASTLCTGQCSFTSYSLLIVMNKMII